MFYCFPINSTLFCLFLPSIRVDLTGNFNFYMPRINSNTLVDIIYAIVQQSSKDEKVVTNEMI